MSCIVLSPDGIPIREKPFASRVTAERGVAGLITRCQVQGYCAGAGFPLKLGEIAARCSLQECSSARKQG